MLDKLLQPQNEFQKNVSFISSVLQAHSLQDSILSRIFQSPQEKLSQLLAERQLQALQEGEEGTNPLLAVLGRESPRIGRNLSDILKSNPKGITLQQLLESTANVDSSLPFRRELAKRATQVLQGVNYVR